MVAQADILASLNQHTAAVLLAAGAGTRFDGPVPKLLADVGGRPLILHALGNVTAANLTPVVVVTGAADLSGVLPASVVAVANPDWAEGQATSLAVAVRWAAEHDMDAIVVGLGDQPGIMPAAWTAIAAADATPIIVATYDGRRGHPVRLHRQVWDRLPRAGDQGARVVMKQYPELVTEIACTGDPTDVDVVDDLRRWR
jgi:CTP:molybdopterin cytidylyltransferase MocA